ncbi:MAG TPA: protein kinase [Planctomycetota bacterium]|nr:protein kinase [Planctomycetota bacterium]
MSERLPPHAVDRLVGDAKELLDAAGGLRVGKYRVVRELGRGGMAVVYEAEDAELGRRVALKCLALPPGAGADLRARFVREARAAARLRHPGIAAIYDATEEAIAMQLVDGAPLSLLPRGDDRRMVRLVRDAALAVHHAHEQGVIHRDLKPHNLLVEGDRVVVTDFGLARDATADASLSLTGHVLGTPAYMAPEQAEGRTADVDARTDVYGLGATLYDLLAGRPPFADRDVVRCLRAVVERDPEPIRRHRPSVPRDLERIVSTCLAKERARRYASARELADDLGRWLDGEPVRAQAPRLVYRIGKLVRRRRALFAAGGVAAAALVAAVLATAARRAEQSASSEALALSSRVASVLADAETYRRLGEVEQARARLDEGIAASRDFLERHDVGQAQGLLGRLLRERGDGEEARRALDRALALEPDLVDARLERGLLLAEETAAAAARGEPGDPTARALAIADLDAIAAHPGGLRSVDVLHAKAERARLGGDRVAARRALDEVLRLDPTHAKARIALSRLELTEGSADAARAMAMSAVDLYSGLGPAYVAKAGGAELVARRFALEGAEQRIGGGDRTSEAWQLRGTARLRLEDVDGALADFSAAVAADPTNAIARAHRGLVQTRRAASLASAGRREDAFAAWGEAAADYAAALVVEPTLAGAHNNAAVCRAERARLLEEGGRSSEAAGERERAIEELDAAIEKAPRFGLAFLNRGSQLRRAAEAQARALRFDEASAALAKARADVDRALELKPSDASALYERARVSDTTARVRGAVGEDALARRAVSEAIVDVDAALGASPDDELASRLAALRSALTSR